MPSPSGLHVNICGQDGMTPLHVAARYGHLHLAKLFVLRGANVQARTSQQHQAPLHVACRHGHTKVSACVRAGNHNKGTDYHTHHFVCRFPCGSKTISLFTVYYKQQ